MNLILWTLGLFLLAAMVAICPIAPPRTRSMLSVVIAVIGAGCGLVPAVQVLAGHPLMSFSAPWQIPYGAFSLRLDGLSAFFLVPILCLGSLTAVYGLKYLLHATEESNLGVAWFAFHLLMVSMVTLVLSANGLMFLLAWEMTVLTSFFLVVLERGNPQTRQAGWLYLTASHMGAGFLIILFLLMARETGSLDFTAFSRAASLPEGLRGLMFLLAVIGFGTKAGFVPLHIWLPEAHPAAPSHVSALMSGVMIKTGIYGLVRFLFFLGHPALWWGWLLLLIGLVTGILGILFAIAQNDLKRLLAYSSVENIGIISLGLGLGLLGLNLGNMPVAVFGFGGALLHVMNHAVFKGLLFLGAGAVYERTGTREINQLGGLLKRMPWTGTSFLVGCLSIAGLPPFNGFIGEFFIYYGAFLAVLNGPLSLADPGLFLIVGLSLIGGLSATCFVKAFSIVFLGNPRSKPAAEAREAPRTMRAPMMLLGVLCFGIVLGSSLLPGILATVLGEHLEFSSEADLAMLLGQALQPLRVITISSLGLIVLLSLVLFWRSRLLADREVRTGVTWDCGYAQPTSAMQYTGPSFAQPITELFHPLFRGEVHSGEPLGYFPKSDSFKTDPSDRFLVSFFRPLFRVLGSLFHRLTWIQNGVVQAYVLYISLTLIVLLLGGLL